MAAKQQSERSAVIQSVTSNKRKIVIIILWIGVIWAGFYGASRLMKPETKEPEKHDPFGYEINVDHTGKPVALPTHAEDSKGSSGDSAEGAAPEGMKTPDTGPQGTPSDGTGSLVRDSSSVDTSIAPLHILPGTDAEQLANLALPNLPYSIYVGAFLDFKECETTQRELLSNLFPAYIVPIEITGKVGQSLFGITENGRWCRVFVGHFGSKQESRKTLGVMMNQGPTDQLEIMKFRYALACGRYTDPEESDRLMARLTTDGFFPYEQTYPTNAGGTLDRVLVGCCFSSQGAQTEKGLLEKKGYACKVVQR